MEPLWTKVFAVAMDELSTLEFAIFDYERVASEFIR
jgi:hypothetical protein